MIEAIDIHQHTARLKSELKKLAGDERLLPANRELLAQFIADARIGRAVKKGARRRISVCRCRKYLTILRRVAMELDGSFEDVTVAEMERFILGIEDGSIQKLSTIKGTVKYSPETVRDFKKVIRRFYKYLWPHDEARVEELTGWFDTRKVQTEHRAFSPEAVPRLARAMGDPQGQALVWLLFDGGFRIGELLNVRLSDVWFKNDSEGRPLCFVRIRVSKTFPRTVALPMATEAVAFWVQRHPCGGPILADGSVDARNGMAPLIRWSYRYCAKRLRAIGEQELGEPLHAHRFRHTSATYYAARLNPYPFCARFGWSMGSAQAERYISRSGLLAEQAAAVPHSSLLRPSDPLNPPLAAQPALVLGGPLAGPAAGHKTPVRSPASEHEGLKLAAGVSDPASMGDSAANRSPRQ